MRPEIDGAADEDEKARVERDRARAYFIAYAAAISIHAPPAWWVGIALVVPAACAATYWEQAETGLFSHR